MAGHSKWANIQHRKGAQDRKRGKIFTKLIRELTVAARIGGPDPGTNPRLRLAVDRARAQNMPRDTVDRAIQRGAGKLDGAEIQEVTYEGYGPGGAAVVVVCMTDNRNRTVAEVRSAFVSFGGHLGAAGSVSYLFNQVGMLSFSSGTDEDALMERSLDAGAEDVVHNEDGTVDVLTDPAEFRAVKETLEAAGFVADAAEITQRSSVHTPLDFEQAMQMMKLLEALEDLDDVQNVYSNAAIPDEVLRRL